MAIRDLKGKVMDKIPVENVLISVFDKTGLESFVPELMEINPNIRFMSTGGTYQKIREILFENHFGGSCKNNLIEVAEYTEFPEMDGGLVKTLHPKIHAGILGERRNPKHQEYLTKTLGDGVFIDMVVGNLYPFRDIVDKIRKGEINPKTKKPYDFESARGNIDIGGPTMLRAAAKNFPSCAAVCNPQDYESIIKDIKRNDGCTTITERLILAEKVFGITGQYDNEIKRYLNEEIHERRMEIVNSYRNKK